MKTTNQERDESERKLNDVVDSAVSGAKTQPEAKGYDAIDYKTRMAAENADIDRAGKEEKALKQADANKRP
jgi:hypothetical protein